MNIGLDVDGVLTDIGSFQIEYGKKYFKKEVVNPNAESIEEMFGVSEEKAKKFWNKYFLKYMVGEKARKGVSEFTKRAHQMGDQITIITARVHTTEDGKTGKLMRYILEEWLKSNKIEYDNIVYCSSDKERTAIEKVEAVKNNNIDIMYEDTDKNIAELSKYTDVVCVDAPYNKNLNFSNIDFTRIKTMGIEAFDALQQSREKKERQIIKNIEQNEVKPLSGKPSIDRPWMKFYSYDERQTKLPEMTCYEYLYKNNKDRQNIIALEYLGRKITYEELFKKIDDFAKAFQAQGVKKGSIVTVCMPNTPEVIYAFYALNKLGAIANMIHPLKSGKEIKNFINNTNSEIMLMIDNSYDEVNKVIDETTLKKAIVTSASDSMPLAIKLAYNAKVKNNVDYSNKKYTKLKDFLSSGKNVELNVPEYEKNQTAVIMYTGGTSGNPKGVELTNENYNDMVHQQKATAKGFKAGDKMLTILPPFHGFGLCSSMHMPLSYGITTILIPKFDHKEFHKLIKKYKPNHIFGIPKLWKAFMDNEEIQKMDLSFIGYVVSGGENMKDGLEESLNEFLHDHNCSSKVKKGYGMTEGVAGLTLSDDYSNEIGSIGIPLLCNRFKVVKPGTEEEVGYNEEGEFCVSGPTVMKDYYNNPEATKKALRTHSDGHVWLHTGDKGYMTEDGMLYYVDRLTRMYVSAGFNIYPPTIEKVIEQLDEVESCAVVPINHPYKDIKVPQAYLILKDGYELDSELKEKIISICKENLDTYHQPFKFEQVETFPVTKLGDNLGKTDYKELERIANSEKAKIKVK